MKAVSLGLCGLGGYGAHILKFLEREASQPEPLLQLTHACEPGQELHADRIAELRNRGIQVFAKFDELLATPIESVWLPLPIHLHRPFTEQALAAGKAVLCEKPITGAIDDLNALIAARDKAKLPVLVGFQDVYEPSIHQLKQAMLDGTIGKVRSITVRGGYPRDSSYYTRNSWAGKLRMGQTWVLDSPATNALAHFIMLPLFTVGKTQAEADVPIGLEAELYRVNDIESYDTCAIRLKTQNGVSLLLLFTHACNDHVTPEMIIHGEHGTATYRMGEQIRIQSKGKAIEIEGTGPDRQAMIHRFARAVRGVEDKERNACTLEAAKSHLITTNGAAEASPVQTIPDELIDKHPQEQGVLRAIPGIEKLLETLVQRQQMPHESGLAKWTRPPGKKDLRGYNHFAGPMQQIT